MKRLARDITAALGYEPRRMGPLSGGCIGEVFKVELSNGETVVAKVDRGSRPQLRLEAYMLRYLAEHSRLPVPQVFYGTDELLLLEFLPGDSSISFAAERHAAELLADLHHVTAPAYGLERDTLIGNLHQPNPWTESWIEFFRDQRLLYLTRETAQIGRMPAEIRRRLERLAHNLDRWLIEPEHPALIHGDVWTSNILTSDGKITGFIDPAIYYAHNEMELAYITLFNTFGDAFFDAYHAHHPVDSDFWQVRRHIYSLYPLLVHVHHFGGGYLNSVERTLSQLRMR